MWLGFSSMLHLSSEVYQENVRILRKNVRAAPLRQKTCTPVSTDNPNQQQFHCLTPGWFMQTTGTDSRGRVQPWASSDPRMKQISWRLVRDAESTILTIFTDLELCLKPLDSPALNFFLFLLVKCLHFFAQSTSNKVSLKIKQFDFRKT